MTATSKLPQGWTETDQRAIDTIRVLAADAVQQKGNGHPGTAMSLAPVAYDLFQKVMRHNPANPDWPGRDRFVLSAGHSSLTLYIQLYLGGFGLELSDIKALRTWGSKTPGHPEHGHTAAVETTTGPLGQGVANAVGMAMAARFERGLFDPQAAPNESPFDHQIYCIASDGDIEEGISSEASSLAGTQNLGNLTLIYDSNHVSIEDDTVIALSEDTAARYEAYGWHVQEIDWTSTGSYVEDIVAFDEALRAAREVSDKPSFIKLRTIIGWPAPDLQGTGDAHGSALGDDEVAATKKALGFDPEELFAVSDEVIEHTRELVQRGRQAEEDWNAGFEEWKSANPENAKLLERVSSRTLPEGWDADLPSFEADPKGIATRKASSKVIQAIAAQVPEFWGGSADLAGSNNTTIEDASSFLPSERSSKKFTGDPYGRVLHFGIREHAMGAIMNGITVHGGTRVFGGTFLTFSDYMRPAVRLAALMRAPVTFVWTHDSVGLGEDGPTHQPIEHIPSLRMIPGLDVVRPADANETTAAWAQIMRNTDRPAGLILSRQNLPIFPRGTDGFADTSNVAKGAYVLKDCDGDPDVVLIGTGSEVRCCVEAAKTLAESGVNARVVSVPCREWFDAQDDAYRQSVLPDGLRARVSIEAAVPQGWRDLVGDAGRTIGIDHFGASADGEFLLDEFGFNAQNVVDKAHESIEAAKTLANHPGETATHRAQSGPAAPGDIDTDTDADQN